MSDHLATVKLSKDGGHNWGSASQHDIGATGEFCVAATRYRNGQHRSLMVECSVSSPFKAPVLAIALQADREAG